MQNEASGMQGIESAYRGTFCLICVSSWKWNPTVADGDPANAMEMSAATYINSLILWVVKRCQSPTGE